MQGALAEIGANLDTSKVQVVGMIHDNPVAYVPEAEALYWAQQVTDIMKILPLGDLGWVTQLIFTADTEAGPNLAALSKLDIVSNMAPW